MRFKYCPDCGTKLIEKEIGDEGNMPYCEVCKKPLFDMFSSCIIALLINEYDEAALLRQDYISNKYHNLISGYIKPGENAEQTAKREIKEEVGVDIDSLEWAGSYWFAKKDLLMLGFTAKAKKCELKLSGEVDSASWVPVEQALTMVHPQGSVSYSLIERYCSGRSK